LKTASTDLITVFNFLENNISQTMLTIFIACRLGYYKIVFNCTGRSPGQAEGLAGCGHSKIARVRVLFVLYVVAGTD